MTARAALWIVGAIMAAFLLFYLIPLVLLSEGN